jgi:hypothetical protein
MGPAEWKHVPQALAAPGAGNSVVTDAMTEAAIRNAVSPGQRMMVILLVPAPAGPWHPD